MHLLREGRVPGRGLTYAIVYPNGEALYVESWDRCRLATEGVSGVLFKRHLNRAQAEGWVQQILGSRSSTPDLELYVDGSYKRGRAGWAWVAVLAGHGEPYGQASGAIDNPISRNVHGELRAAREAVLWAARMRHRVGEAWYARVQVVHDYMGTQAWATGAWAPNGHPEVDRLLRALELAREVGLVISWRHVKGHKGDRWNEQADKLAGEALEAVA